MAYYRDGEFDSFNPDETIGFSHSFAGLSANLEKPNGWAYGENNQSSMDLHLSRMREYPSEDMRILPPISPYAGIHIRDVDDFFPRGFTSEELDRVYHKLLGYDEPKMFGLVAEAAEPFDAMDEYYNPGVDVVSDAAIFEAIVVDKFSKTEHRMLAVKRAFKKYMGDSEIQVLDPIVGQPKTTGGFAYVTVQFPFTDGQVITIVFHSPEGDKKKIGPQDQIIAYQWLLNKRDITEVVAPENGKEISLENICKKTSQLLIKNSKRFEKQQKQAIEEKKQLADLTAQVKEAEAHQAELMDQVAGQQQAKSDLELELSQTLALVEKQKAINAELQATLDGLRKGAKEKQAAPAQAGTSGNTGSETIPGFDRNALMDAAAKKKNLSAKQLEQMSDVELLCAAGKYADLDYDEQDEQARLFVLNAKKLAKNSVASLKNMANDNNTTAMVALYYRYKDANPTEAFKWYQKAAEAGNVVAQRDMPMRLSQQPIPDEYVLDKGTVNERVKEDYTKKHLEECNYWLKKAVEQGNLSAMEEFNDNDIILAKEMVIGGIPSKIADAVPGMIAAPVFLTEKGAEHIQEGHAKELEQRDMSPAEFVENVINGFDSIYAGNTKDTFQLVCKSPTSTSDRVVVGVQKVGNSYRVITASPANIKFLSRKTLLWEDTAHYLHSNSEELNPHAVHSDKAKSENGINNSPAEVNPSGEKNSTLTPGSAYMAEIQDIIDGKQDAMGSKAMGDRLDAIYDLSEKDGTLDTVEPMLSKAADRVTMLMKKEHEHA